MSFSATSTMKDGLWPVSNSVLASTHVLTRILGAVIRMSRIVTEECMKWSNQRLVFGKKLIEQPVIRQK
jgi:hypothetical protein